MRKRWTGGGLGALALLSVLGACAGGAGLSPKTPSISESSMEVRALLLLIADRKLWEPFTIARAEEAGLQPQLALALGRIGDSRARPDLERLMFSTDSDTAVNAAFALGLLGDSDAESALLRAARDRDVGLAARAVESLGKLGVELTVVEKSIEGLGEVEVLQRLAPFLFRFSAESVTSVAIAARRTGRMDLSRYGAYALGRVPAPEAVPELRKILAEKDPWLRGMAARGVGRVGEVGDLDLLFPLLSDSEPGPPIQALRAAQALVMAGKSAPAPAWRGRLLQLLEDPRPGVRNAAVAASGAWLLDERLSLRLVRFIESGEPWERELALQALAEGEDPIAPDLVQRLAQEAEWNSRSAAARAAAVTGSVEVLNSLVGDADRRVRAAAFAALLPLTGAQNPSVVELGLSDRDPVTRATVLEWLAEHPDQPIEALATAIEAPMERMADAKLAGIRALEARALSEPLERGGIIAYLESLARDPEYLVRRGAADALANLGRPRPSAGALTSGLSTTDYGRILLQTQGERWAEVITRHGRLELRLDCPRVPMTCMNFLQLANQGYYDGLTFHRVVADFVVQGGDPRGDGWGGPGYTIRDEVDLTPYDRGVVGMALSGKDTGGSQFFITLSRQPHLDGCYTAFGRVISGDAILDRIVQGDRIERLREISRPRSRR